MPTYRVQCALQDVSGLAKDQYVNTFYFDHPTGEFINSSWDFLDAGFAQFYKSLQGLLSSGITKDGHTIKYYLVGAPLESPPVRTSLFGFAGTNPGAVGAFCLPGEVACCLTFHADPQPGVPRQSWRGRVYVGPFNSSVLDKTPTFGNARPGVPLKTALLAGAVALDEAIGSAGSQWVIYSRKLGRVFPVSYASVDDAWDTQRRRGVAPTASVITAPLHGAGVPPGPA